MRCYNAIELIKTTKWEITIMSTEEIKRIYRNTAQSTHINSKPYRLHKKCHRLSDEAA